MITPPKQSPCYMGADSSWNEADWIMLGLPYDGTSSYRPGSRFAPSAIREASWGLEMYSPFLDRDLLDIPYRDEGDLELPFGNREEALIRINQAAEDILKQDKKWIGLGGEHLVTLPVIEAYVKKYSDLVVVHFDAHADLREDYLGEPLSHATVMRHIVNMVSPSRYIQIGIRSGTRAEFEWMKTHQTLVKNYDELRSRLKILEGKPIFLSIDLDVLDPSILPGTSTPEPGGMTFAELQSWLSILKNHLIVGFDVVELSPPYDNSEVSSIVAAKVVRECLLLA